MKLIVRGGGMLVFGVVLVISVIIYDDIIFPARPFPLANPMVWLPPGGLDKAAATGAGWARPFQLPVIWN